MDKIPGFSEISKKVESLLTIPDITMNPSGSADLTFQIVNNYRNDPALDANKRSVTTFDFDENIQVSLNAKIGDLFNFDINWNTQANTRARKMTPPSCSKRPISLSRSTPR